MTAAYVFPVTIDAEVGILSGYIAGIASNLRALWGLKPARVDFKPWVVFVVRKAIFDNVADGDGQGSRVSGGSACLMRLQKCADEEREGFHDCFLMEKIFRY